MQARSGSIDNKAKGSFIVAHHIVGQTQIDALGACQASGGGTWSAVTAALYSASFLSLSLLSSRICTYVVLCGLWTCILCLKAGSTWPGLGQLYTYYNSGIAISSVIALLSTQ